jgi:hypothetical protein
MFGPVVLALGLAFAYWIWPTGITNLPLASITLGALLQAVSSVLTALVSLWIAVSLWK